ncbi:MAG: elongation factor P [Pirellulales bacterium]
MAYNTSDFKKGIKVQIDGDPYLMLECNFVKPGKGQALYKCKFRNLIRGGNLDRTYKSGDSLDEADVVTIDAQYLYRSGDAYVFMNNEDFEQYEIPSNVVGDAAQWMKEAVVCTTTLYNNVPISVEPPNQMVLQIVQCDPGTRGNTATNVTKPCKLETGAVINGPAFLEEGETIKVDTRTNEYIERVKV